MGKRVRDVDHERYAVCRHGQFWAHNVDAGEACSGPHYTLADGRCACWDLPKENVGVVTARQALPPEDAPVS